MDFRNEGLNMLKMQEVLDASEFFDSSEIVIPKPFMPLSSRSDTCPPAACCMHPCFRATPGLAKLHPAPLAACSLVLQWPLYA